MCRVRVKVKVHDVSIEHPIEDFQNDLDLDPADNFSNVDVGEDFQDQLANSLIDHFETSLMQQFQAGLIQQAQAGTGGISQQAQAGMGGLSQQAQAGGDGPSQPAQAGMGGPFQPISSGISQQSQAGAGEIIHPLTGTDGISHPLTFIIQESIDTPSQSPLAGGLQQPQAGTGGLLQQAQESAGGVSQSNLTDPLVPVVQQQTAMNNVFYQAIIAAISGTLQQQPETSTGEPSQQSQVTSTGVPLQQQPQANIGGLSQQAQSGTSGLSHQFEPSTDELSHFVLQGTAASFQQPQAAAVSLQSQASTGDISLEAQAIMNGLIAQLLLSNLGWTSFL